MPLPGPTDTLHTPAQVFLHAWHHMSTAPTDGTRILLWYGEPGSPANPEPEGDRGWTISSWGTYITDTRHDSESCWLDHGRGRGGHPAVRDPQGWMPAPHPMDALDEPHDPWRPLANAPLDGTMILLWLSDECEVVNGFWSPGSVGDGLPFIEPGWFSEPGPGQLGMQGGPVRLGALSTTTPTHWMPMLPGPAKPLAAEAH